MTESDELQKTQGEAPTDEPDLLAAMLHGTVNAGIWAREWCRVAREILGRQGMGPEALAVLPAPVSFAFDALIDEGWMLGWFANAIETARSLSATVIAQPPFCTDEDDHLARLDKAYAELDRRVQEENAYLAAHDDASGV